MATKDFWDKSADVIVFLALTLGFLFCAIVLGWQLMYWLRTSEWQSLPFLIAFQFVGINAESVYAPQSWLGLAKATQFVLELPMSIMVPVCGFLLAVAWKSFVSSGTAR